MSIRALHHCNVGFIITWSPIVKTFLIIVTTFFNCSILFDFQRVILTDCYKLREGPRTTLDDVRIVLVIILGLAGHLMTASRR